MPVPKVRPALLPCVDELVSEVAFVVNEVKLVVGRVGGECILNVGPDIVEFSAGILTRRLSS